MLLLLLLLLRGGGQPLHTPLSLSLSLSRARARLTFVVVNKKGKTKKDPPTPQNIRLGSLQVEKKGLVESLFRIPLFEHTGPHRSILFRFLALKDYYYPQNNKLDLFF